METHTFCSLRTATSRSYVSRGEDGVHWSETDTKSGELSLKHGLGRMVRVSLCWADSAVLISRKPISAEQVLGLIKQSHMTEDALHMHADAALHRSRHAYASVR